MKKTVKEIIENVQAFHLGLSEYFILLKKNARDKRAEMLLDYLGEHEECIARHLTNYLHDSQDKTLNLWINVVPWLPSDIFCSCAKNMDIAAPLSVDDIVDIAVHYDDCLIDFFSVLVKETKSVEAESMFSNFLKQAKNEEKKLVRNSLWLHGL